MRTRTALLLIVVCVVSGCQGSHVDATPRAQASVAFSKAAFDRQLAQRGMTPEGPAAQPWLQAIEPSWVDTTRYRKPAPWKVCFSNADLNPWRVAP